MKHFPRRAALAVATLAASAAIVPAASAATFSTPSKVAGAATGITVQPGDTITGSVSSDFNICGGTVNNDCFTGRIQPAAPSNPQFFLPNRDAGGGYYRIGDGAWKAFTASPTDQSTSTPEIADAAGQLFITTNDFAGSPYDDNLGTLSVTTFPDRPAFGKGVSGVGTTFDFVITSLNGVVGGHARLDMNPDRRYGLREGDVTCFNQVGQAAIFGIADTAGTGTVYREFYIKDGATTGTPDRISGIGKPESTPPPSSCRTAVPKRTSGKPIRSGDISLGGTPTVPPDTLN